MEFTQGKTKLKYVVEYVVNAEDVGILNTVLNPGRTISVKVLKVIVSNGPREEETQEAA